MITFGIIIGSISIALIAGDAAWNLVGKREELKRLRSINGKLAQENLALRNTNELLEAQVKSKQYVVDVMKQTQIDDLTTENRRLRTMLEQKWEGAKDASVTG